MVHHRDLVCKLSQKSSECLPYLNQDNQDWDIKPQRTQRDAEKDQP